MRRTILIVLLFFLLVPFGVAVYAQETDESTSSASVAQTGRVVEYPLPYPGLLPDSPLYFIKAARDSIISFLISDPNKKAEFNLLQADKHLQAGIALLSKGDAKRQLALETFTKGEGYFAKALLFAKDAKKLGFSMSDVAGRLVTSAKKHQEVYRNTVKQLTGEDQQKVNALIKKMAEHEKTAVALTR